MKTTYLYNLLFLFFLPLFSAQAAICTSLSDGNWSNPAIWSCGQVPDPDDDVVVIAHDVVLDQDVEITYNNDNVLYGLTINAGASLIDNGMHTLQIGQGNGNGYNGINILGILDVYILTLEKAQSPSSILASTGEITIRCYFENTNRGDIDVNGFLNILGDWHVGNGNTDTNGNGFILVTGCLNTAMGGQLDNIIVDFCVVEPVTDCLCFNGGSDSGAVGNPNGEGNGSQGTTGGSAAECLGLLPVTYLSFTGKIEEATSVCNAKSILEWTTVTELNHEKFVIERSLEGKKFEEVGTLQAKGAKNTLTDYIFTDENIEERVYYYRLKEVSPSDETTYSPIITLQVNADLFFKIFPNPISKGQKLHIYYPSSMQLLRIQNSRGQLLFEEKQDDTNHSHLEIPINLPKGMYFIQIYTQEKILYRRLIVE